MIDMKHTNTMHSTFKVGKTAMDNIKQARWVRKL